MKELQAARILAVHRHPGADRLWLVQLAAGSGKPVVVAGGDLEPQPGMTVIYAPPGSRVPAGKIRARTYRGQRSEGMLCSLAELGWHDGPDEIAVLPEDFLPGALLTREGVMGKRESGKP
jgi:phenylalanyl-tRNA synthetase beta chain